MTETMSRNVRISTILIVLALLLIAPWSAKLSFAYADDGTEYEIDRSHVCTDRCYSNIYYLTDNPAAEYYVNGFLGDMANMYAQQHTVFNEFKYYDLAAINCFTWRSPLETPRFGDSTLFFDYKNISNALVIFEIDEWLPFQFSNGSTYYPTYELYDIFLKLKSQKCRIMFICNTDELYFNDDGESNRFLDLADVHVNTDIHSFFIQTFLTIYTENTIQNSTVILDASMAQHAVRFDDCRYTENEYRYVYDRNNLMYGSRYGFVDGMLLPHIRKTLYLPRTGAYPDNARLLQDKDKLNINILCYLGGGMFLDLANDRIYTYGENDYWSFIQDYESEYYYFLGSTRYGDSSLELQEWMKYVEDYAGKENMFDKYMYVEKNPFNMYEGGTDMHVAGMTKSRTAQFISPVVFCFLFRDVTGDDLDSFDNWEGRCKVTVKPTSDDSWLLPLTDPEDTINSDEEQQYYGM